MDRGGQLREELDRILRPQLAGEHEEHQINPGRRGYKRKYLAEITWPSVPDENGELNVFPVDADQLPVVAPPVEAPANPQAPRAALTAEEEDLALLLVLGAVYGLPQQIEREASNTVIVPVDTDDDDDDDEVEALNTAILPAIVDAGLVSTVRLVDNGDGSGPTLASTLEVRVARQTK